MKALEDALLLAVGRYDVVGFTLRVVRLASKPSADRFAIVVEDLVGKRTHGAVDPEPLRMPESK